MWKFSLNRPKEFPEKILNKVLEQYPKQFSVSRAVPWKILGWTHLKLFSGLPPAFFFGIPSTVSSRNLSNISKVVCKHSEEIPSKNPQTKSFGDVPTFFSWIPYLETSWETPPVNVISVKNNVTTSSGLPWTFSLKVNPKFSFTVLPAIV